MVSDPADLLREHGIQVQAQRLAVLRAVSAHAPITADAVADAVRGEIGAISTQSVYDALAVLLKKGLLRRIQPAGSAARFDDRVGDNHHHLICRVCDHLVDVDCAAARTYNSVEVNVPWQTNPSARFRARPTAARQIATGGRTS